MTGLWFSLALLSLQSPPPQALKELLVISGEETGEYLTTVSDITVDRRGRIYVAQPQDHSIIVFEKTGTFAARFGRQGSGPGEFRGLRTLTWVGDTLFSVDATLLRLSGFNSSGQHVGDAPRVASHLPDGLVGMGPRTILSNRTIIAIPQYRTGRKPVPIQLYARDGAYIKSLGEVVNSGENYRVQVGKVVSQFSAMVRWSTILATSPVGDGIVIVDPGPPTTGTAGSYTITRVGLNGNVL